MSSLYSKLVHNGSGLSGAPNGPPFDEAPFITFASGLLPSGAKKEAQGSRA